MRRFVRRWPLRFVIVLASTACVACGQALAQDDDVAPTDEGPSDVLRAPPPEPEERPAAPAPKPKPKPAPKPAPVLTAAPVPAVTPPPAAAATAAAPAAASAAAVAVDQTVAPPPPVKEGDFAGKGAAPATTPQDDFDPQVQEYPEPKFKREYSIRIDPLNWLLLGRLGIELEVSLFKYLTVQVTPIFVTAQSPIAVNYAGLDDPVKQRSNGLGPISGLSVGVGAWFWAEPFHGYVLRLELTNYGYEYRTSDSAGAIDRVAFTERRLQLFVGSHSRFGVFTFAGGFGLGYELNQQSRCALTGSAGAVQARDEGCHGKQWIALDRDLSERMNLNGPLHPVYFLARFTLGVVF